MMKIFKDVDHIGDIGETAVALGNFDGVHKGHQALIRRAVERARQNGVKSAVFTFNNHPKNVMTGRRAVRNILYWDDKVKILSDLGVDYLFAIPFDERVQHLDPTDFIKELLVKRFHMKEAFCGFNYHFGYRAAGNVELLAHMEKKWGYRLHVMEPVTVNGRIVSSTLLRSMIAEGEVEKCMDYMGRHYTVGGMVVVGNRIGRTMGFPTSNITIDDAMITPSNGVYVTDCIYQGLTYESVTNVGLKPTIGDNQKNIETHMFQFDKEIYGNWIRVEFLKKIRDEHKFSGVEELGQQIQKDCEIARKYHAALKEQELSEKLEQAVEENAFLL